MAKRGLVVVESPTKVKTIRSTWTASTSSRPPWATSATCPSRKLGVDPKKGFKPEYVVAAGQEEGPRRAQEGGREGATRSTSPPTPTGKGRRSAGTWPRSWRSAKKNVHRITFNEITERAVRRRSSTRARSTSRRSTPSRPGACSTGSSATSLSPLLWEQDPPRACRPGACSRWRCGSSPTASARSSAFVAGRVLVAARPPRRRKQPPEFTATLARGRRREGRRWPTRRRPRR